MGEGPFVCVYLLSRKLHEERSLHKIARWALRFSPLTGINSEKDGITIDLRGTSKLYRNKEPLARAIQSELDNHAVAAKLALAPTIGAAWALARHSNTLFSVVEDKHCLAQILGGLNVRALRISEQTIEALRHSGINLIGELNKLPRKALGLRYGPELLKRLDQAFGLVEEILTTTHAPPNFALTTRFDPPLTNRSGVRAVIITNLKKLFEKLAQSHKKAANFLIQLQLGTEGGVRCTKQQELCLHSATLNFSSLSQTIDVLVEQLASGGYVHSISIIPRNLERICYQQRDMRRAQEQVDAQALQSELLNNLSLRLGRQQLQQLHLKASHLPENSFRYAELKDPAARTTIPQIDLPLNRPPYLLQRPEPFNAIALLPDHPPSRISWNGVSYTIIGAAPSEKITEEWWVNELRSEADLPERHYFKIQDHTGRWLWVFRDSGMRWFVHGIWA
ncbi:MAG: hypothetical protein K1X83_08355 [Oligoflexia bacterium]|nr:hypothetical protein [Oligoflexia bacterium]